jgi:hypothetical protein
MALRAFASAWHEVDSGVEQSELTPNPMLEQVMLVHIKRAKGEID